MAKPLSGPSEMTFWGYEGPAGTGKTYRLIHSVRAQASESLTPGQRILGLTFMHGSRRRLDESLANHTEIRGRYTALTADSFANYLVRRWKFATLHVPPLTEFDAVCDTAGELLERTEVARWVAGTFGILVVDEAQELKPCRLRITKALVPHIRTYVAADEFQCLDEAIDTEPFMEWFSSGHVENLTQVHRTNRRGLLDAGLALREGRPVREGAGLKVSYQFPNQVKFAVGHALRHVHGSAALLLAPARPDGPSV